MKIQVLSAAIAALLLSACGGGPLSEAECRKMFEQTVDVSLAGAPAEEREAARKFLLDASEQSITQCAAGDLWERDDYDCVMAADSVDDLNACTGAMAG